MLTYTHKFLNSPLWLVLKSSTPSDTHQHPNTLGCTHIPHALTHVGYRHQAHLRMRFPRLLFPPWDAGASHHMLLSTAPSFKAGERSLSMSQEYVLAWYIPRCQSSWGIQAAHSIQRGGYAIKHELTMLARQLLIVSKITAVIQATLPLLMVGLIISKVFSNLTGSMILYISPNPLLFNAYAK